MCKRLLWGLFLVSGLVVGPVLSQAQQNPQVDKVMDCTDEQAVNVTEYLAKEAASSQKKRWLMSPDSPLYLDALAPHYCRVVERYYLNADHTVNWMMVFYSYGAEMNFCVEKGNCKLEEFRGFVNIRLDGFRNDVVAAHENPFIKENESE